MSQLCINMSAGMFNVTNSSGTKIGTIAVGELYAMLSWGKIAFYGPTGPAIGYMPTNLPGSMQPAYSSDYDNSTPLTNGLFVFKVRHKSRVWQGKTEFTSLYSGDLVAVDGLSMGDTSSTDYTRPYKLMIKEYRQSGTWRKPLGVLSVDTDIELSYCRHNTVGIYGTWNGGFV